MATTTITEAFRRHRASLVNPQWAVSAIAEDGSCVMSCWSHYLKKHGGGLRYTDQLSRWSGNIRGNNLARKHLELIQVDGLPIRLVIAHTNNSAVVDSGESAASIKNTFSCRQEFIGSLVSFDGDEFVIDFNKAET